MKKSNAKILASLFAVFFLLNLLFFQGCKDPGTAKKEDPLSESTDPRIYSAYMGTTCTDTIILDTAKSWMGKVKDIRFNNKSIFICADAINSMMKEPGFNGIWVRRGMDGGEVIHDLGWASRDDGVFPTAAFLLEWRSCVCEPCCDSDSSDFREYY